MSEHRLSAVLCWTSPAVGCGGCFRQAKMSHCKFEREYSIPVDMNSCVSVAFEPIRAPP